MGQRQKIAIPGKDGEDTFWKSTLKNLAAHLGAPGEPVMHSAIVDPKVQWREWKNIQHNAGMRTALYIADQMKQRLATLFD